LLILTGDKFLSVPTQQNRDGGALFVLFLVTIILFPVRKETVHVRRRMVYSWEHGHEEGEKFAKEV
jgi:hypothetical protein